MKPARTSQQAKEIMLTALDTGQLGAMDADGRCLYQDSEGRHCVIGILFEPAQIRDIKERQLDSSVIQLVAHVLGEKNVEHVCGMTIDRLAAIQQRHDDWCGAIHQKDTPAAVQHQLDVLKQVIQDQ